MVTEFEYKWVKSHMDNYKLWHQLTLEQQLNCTCDTLAKQTVRASLDPRAPAITHQVLPRESAAVFIGGAKQTTDVAREV